MAEVLVVTSGKGGVGKTTATANLGVSLALLDRRTLVIDSDIGLRNLDLVLGVEASVAHDWLEYLEGKVELKQVILQDGRFPGLHILPASQFRGKESVNAKQMRRMIDLLRPHYDYILIDSPAGIELGFRNAASVADTAVIVTTPEISALRDADRIIGLLEGLKIHDIRLIINRLRPDLIARGDMMSCADIISLLTVELIGLVEEDDRVVVASNRGEPAALDPLSRAGEAYRIIARRLCGEIIPIEEPVAITEAAGLWDRFLRWFTR
ncbi:MAG: septum site-determining protein MinD [Symbiobacteriaceae bacterium]|nr:septum site-determining protein MinD [Symbiobacteriaceae bacterium]